MPELVACPNCERKLKVPETLLGKRVKCPGCQTTFTAASSAAAPPRAGAPAKSAPPPRRKHADDEDGPEQYDVATNPDNEEENAETQSKKDLLERHFRDQRLEDERSKRGKRPFTEEWRKSRLGIRILSLAVFILLAGFITQLAGRGIIWFVTRPEDIEPNPTPRQREAFEARVKDAEAERKEKRLYLTSAVAIVALVHQVVAIIGIGVCLLSPEKDNLRLLVIPALVLALGSLGLEIALSVAPLQYLTSGAVDASGSIPAPHPGLKIAGDLVGYLRFFAFLFFMWMIGKSTKSDELKREVLMLIIFMAVTILFWLVMAAITAVRLASELPFGVGAIAMEGSLIGVLGMSGLALVLASVVWFIMTLYTTTLTIADWLREKR